MNGERTTEESGGENNCVVCCREVYIYAIGECDHPVCFECATRMRVLCRQNECPICRRELPKIFFVKNRRQYADVAHISFPLSNRKYNLYFEDTFVQQAHCKLLEHRCQICENEPSFQTFVALKDHVRKTHELFFCDICIKHLLIFTCERKCYNRQDLATHRRRGDPDDTSHRGHPLCEFCNDRFLDDDELFRHLRREHFFCHFCDTDGHNHYYSDYEYLRKHFRAEHFLCEEGECLNEKFTTAFRSEIDLKAHRALVHNKGLTKAQAKQARTLELEFSIAPRGAANSDDIQSRAYYDADDSSSRRGRRRGGGAYGNSHRGGSSRDYAQPYNSRYEDVDGVLETVNTAQNPAPASPNINMNSSQDFPTLGVAPSVNGTAPHSANSAPDTLARKLAKINRFTVGSGMGDDEFPELRSAKGPAQSKIASKFKGSNSWGATGTTTLSLTSSQAPAPSAAMSRKTLTVKLNSHDDFPGLLSTKKQSAVPKVSIQVDHKRNTTGTNSAESNRPKNSSDRQPVVTRMASSQNITFINPPASVQTKFEPVREEPPVQEKPRPPEFAEGLSKTDGGWYVLKKGKAAKSKSPPDEVRLKELSLEEDFPSLASKATPPRLKEPRNEKSPTPQNSWSAQKTSKADGQKAKADSEKEARKMPDKNESQQTTATAKTKKKKKAAANGAEAENLTNGSAENQSDADRNDVTEAKGRKTKRAELKLETVSATSTAKDPANGQMETQNEADRNNATEPKGRKTKRTELKLENVVAAPNDKYTAFGAAKKDAHSTEDFPDLPSKCAGAKDPAVGTNGLTENRNDATEAKGRKTKRTELKLETGAVQPQPAEKNVFTAEDFPDLAPKRATVPAKRRSELRVVPLTVPSVATRSDAVENTKNAEARPRNGAVFAASDFPDLISEPRVPPGFVRLEAKPSRPPPGFVSAPVFPSAPAKPPPGFDSTNNPLGVAQTTTFTNSVGQNFSFPRPIPCHAYAQPEESQRRNQELADRLRDALGGDERGFALFKDISAGFRKGSVGAGEYYDRCVELMGPQRFAGVFPELLVLLPDIGKQQELLAVHNVARKADAGNPGSAAPFLVCASCQQVLAGKDFRAHESSHSLDNFPALDDLIHTSRISWTKRN